MEALKKENYSQPILIKQASLRDVTATGSHSNYNKWDKSNHKIDFKQIFSFIKNIIGNYRNRD